MSEPPQDGAAPSMGSPAATAFMPAPSISDATIIQLDDVAAQPTNVDVDSVARMTGDHLLLSSAPPSLSKGGAGVRSRGAASSSSSNRIDLAPPTQEMKRNRDQQDQDDFDPVQELLDVLPPPLARLLVRLGKKLNPAGIKIVDVKKTLRDDQKGGNVIYTSNKPQHLINALTLGLRHYGMALAVAAVVWIFTQIIAPGFFLYPFFYFDLFGIFSSWLFFLWGGFISGAVWYVQGRDVKCYGRPFIVKLANSLITAVAEELGYRFLFICFTMVALYIFNVLIEHTGLYLGGVMAVLGLAAAIVSGLYMLDVLKNNELVKRVMKNYNPIHVVVGSVMVLVAGVFVFMMGLVWGVLFSVLSDWVLFPTINFLTAYQYDRFFMGAFGMNANSYEGMWIGGKMRRKIWHQNADDSRLFILAVLLTNLLYRDGRKFQGVVGWVNSLIVGFVLANCMVNHGIFTAIAVHLLYDLQYYLAGFLVNKYSKKKRPTLDDM